MPKRKRNFRWVKWLLFLMLVIAAVVVVVLVKNNFDQKPVEEKDQSIDVEKPENKKGEKPNDDSDDTEEIPEQEQKVPQYEGDSPNKSETLTGLITYADVQNDELVMRVNIDQFLQAGTCNLTMSRNGVTYYSQSVDIQESVTTSTCDGYKIPVSELPKGDLSVEINLESEGRNGKITGRVRI